MAGPSTTASAATCGKLQRLRVVLVGVGGADAGTFERHGYAGAMRTQIDHGIFDYCGARVVRSELLLESESADPIRHLDQALHIGSQLFAARGAQRPPRRSRWRPDPRGHSARCMAKPARCGASSSRRVSAGIR